MNGRRWLFLFVCWFGLHLSCGAQGTDAPANSPGNDLAGKVSATRASEGVELRMEVVVTRPADSQPPFKLALIGQFNQAHDRMLVRGISPANVQGLHIYSERDGAGNIHTVSYRSDTSDSASDAFSPINPELGLFGSDLTIQDFYWPWFRWRNQTLAGEGRANGKVCQLLKSVNDDPASLMQEVVSCIDTESNIALRTEIYGAHHRLSRIIDVVATVSNRQGQVVAKTIRVTGERCAATEARVYSGDEEYPIRSNTFPVLATAPGH